MKTKVIIIGAGPIGLYFASKCEEAKIDYLLLEATSNLGGQLTRLYPEKEIIDIPGISSIKSKDYITYLLGKVNQKNIILNSLVTDIVEGSPIVVKTNNKNYECDKLIIATGLGFSKPRPLGVVNEEKCDNILYSLKDFSFLKNKRVAIFGGGDSALDWAKAISEISNDVHLIHRRTEFRGNPDTIKNCANLTVHLPYIPDSIEVDENQAKSVKIKEVVCEGNAAKIIAIPVDYILVNYGNIAGQSPFKFDSEGSFINVDENNQIKFNIFAIGDVSNYENKKRRIAPGIIEADKVFKIIN